jgi:nicotinamidase-related amidase
MPITTLDPKTALVLIDLQRGIAAMAPPGALLTSTGVESTARRAHELGYNITLAVNAVADLHAESHAHSLARIFPRLAETGSTADVLRLLPVRAAA